MGVWHEARAWEAECASNGINIGFGRGCAAATMPKVSPTTSASGMICTCVRAVLGDDVERRVIILCRTLEDTKDSLVYSADPRHEEDRSSTD